MHIGSHISNMMNYVSRAITGKIRHRLNSMPAVARLGPRQCGKTTLARMITSDLKGAVYIDLERRADLNKLRDPEAFFNLNDKQLICLDEIQRVPEIFQVDTPYPYKGSVQVIPPHFFDQMKR